MTDCIPKLAFVPRIVTTLIHLDHRIGSENHRILQWRKLEVRGHKGVRLGTGTGGWYNVAVLGDDSMKETEKIS